MTEDRCDIEASGLLDGLEGDARAERAELIDWLLQDGFSVERIKGEVAPMLLPAGRYRRGRRRSRVGAADL